MYFVFILCILNQEKKIDTLFVSHSRETNLRINKMFIKIRVIFEEKLYMKVQTLRCDVESSFLDIFGPGV